MGMLKVTASLKSGGIMFTRTLGKSGIAVSAMGLGCWAIGGVWSSKEGCPAGWGRVDDKESIRAIHEGIDSGVTLFDTADSYGCGHSERILRQALVGQRDRVVIATKFGYVFSEQCRQVTGSDASPRYVRRACEASLRRLNTDYIDLYQFHIHDYDIERAAEVLDVLEELVTEGKIRWYGWSTNDPVRARAFAQGPHCAAIQHHLNILEGNPAILSLCEEYNLASICRGPLSMGLLTGKFNAKSRLPPDDVRSDWNLCDGEEARLIEQLDKIRPVLTSDGRTLSQASLGWIWARSERTIPIPGFKTVAQVEENTRASRFGPLSKGQMEQIERLLERVPAELIK
jgi:aryl-alcohol dehydrogenase-like predicted oxidoreductase